MAYQFETNANATFTFPKSGDVDKLALKGVSGTTSDATTVITGIQGLLYIADVISRYEPETGERTVTQYVTNNS